MRVCRISLPVFGTAFLLATAASAERAPEQRGRASHVVTGRVAGVYVREKGDTRYYLVEIAVEKVEEGSGLKPGEMCYVGCYLWNPNWRKGERLSAKERRRLAFRGAAYDGVPKEGQRVWVYAKQSGGRFEGIYPDWYDVLGGK